MTVHVESKHEKGVHVRSQRHSQCYILDLVGPTVTPPAQPSVLGFSTSAKQHSCWYSRFSAWMLLMMRTLLRTKRCLFQPLLPGRRERAVAPGEYGTDRAEDTVQKKPAAFGASNAIFRAYSGAASSPSALVTSPTKGSPPAESSPIC